jgi:hypothetical protein
MKRLANYKIYLLLILTLSLTKIYSTRKTKEVKDFPYLHKCNQELVRSFGLIGKTVPSSAPMEMCPSVKDSCCTKKDQMNIYNNWINMKESEYVTRLFDIVQERYIKFLVLLTNVEVLIKNILKKLEMRKISNCKVLGKRILHFEITALVPQIKKNIKKMRNFLEQSYKGVYCSICDHDNHMFIEDDKRIINYCDSFCREMLESGLPFLLFFHVDIVKLTNMISKFMVSCDYKGDYDTESLIPKQLIFFEDADEKNQLEDCRKNRNKTDWMAYCTKICENFNISIVSPYYMPNFDKISKFNKWLADMLDQKKLEHKHNPLFEDTNGRRRKMGDNGVAKGKNVPQKEINITNTRDYHIKENHRILTSKSTKKGRLLQSKKVKNSKENKILNREKIFISKINTKFPLEVYKTNFSGQGMCLYETGLASLINDSVYNEVKTIYHLSKMKKSPNGIVHIVKKMIGIGGITREEQREIDRLNSSSKSLIVFGKVNISMLSSLMLTILMSILF